MTPSKKRNATKLVVSGLLAASTSFFGSHRAHAGPWVDENAGHGYFQLSYTRYQAEDYFSGPGEEDSMTFKAIKQGVKRRIKVPLPTGSVFPQSIASNYLSQDAAIYGEVTLGERFAAVVSMPMVRDVRQDVYVTDTQHSNLTTLHAGDLTFGVKKQLPRIKALPNFAFGPQVYLTAPTGDVNARAAYPTNIPNVPITPGSKLPVPTGNGTWDITALGSFGYSFHPVPVFVAADVGIHHHWDAAVCKSGKTTQTVTYSDDVPYNVQIGGTWAPKKKWFDHATLIANLNGMKSLENGYVPAPASKGSPFADFCGQSNNASAFNIGGTIQIFPIKYLGVTYTIAHTITGINVGYGLTNSVGLATQF